MMTARAEFMRQIANASKFSDMMTMRSEAMRQIAESLKVPTFASTMVEMQKRMRDMAEPFHQRLKLLSEISKEIRFSYTDALEQITSQLRSVTQLHESLREVAKHLTAPLFDSDSLMRVRLDQLQSIAKELEPRDQALAEWTETDTEKVAGELEQSINAQPGFESWDTDKKLNHLIEAVGRLESPSLKAIALTIILSLLSSLLYDLAKFFVLSQVSTKRAIREVQVEMRKQLPSGSSIGVRIVERDNLHVKLSRKRHSELVGILKAATAVVVIQKFGKWRSSDGSMASMFVKDGLGSSGFGHLVVGSDHRTDSKTADSSTCDRYRAKRSVLTKENCLAIRISAAFSHRLLNVQNFFERWTVA